jgi:hypothetical protein
MHTLRISCQSIWHHYIFEYVDGIFVALALWIAVNVFLGLFVEIRSFT